MKKYFQEDYVENVLSFIKQKLVNKQPIAREEGRLLNITKYFWFGDPIQKQDYAPLSIKAMYDRMQRKVGALV